MAQMDPQPGAVSPELDEMVCDLIGALLDELAAGNDPGVALAVADDAGNAYEAFFADDGEEQCLEAATQFVCSHAGKGVPEEGVGRLERYALGYAGCVELEDGYHDAVLVSFNERALPCGYSAYVLFEGFGQGDNFMWSDPEPAGEEPTLF